MIVIYEPKGRALEYSLLAINHYKGCYHGCSYCYAASQVRRWGDDSFHKVQTARPGVIEALKKQAPEFACTDKRVLLCFTTDPYQPLDDELRLTRQVIKILRKYSIPFQVLTKGGMRAVKDFDLYGKCDSFATTMTFMDTADSLELEPQAATPDDRIKAINRAHEKGIQTWVSLEPVIDPAQSLDIISMTYKIVDLYKIGKLNHIKPPAPIDWLDFGRKAIAMCEAYGVKYYVKDDLAKHLSGVEFTSTDTRRVGNDENETSRHRQGSQAHLFTD